VVESNSIVASNDVKKTGADAQVLHQAATALPGGKAEEVGSRSMYLFDKALAKCEGAQQSVLVAGKKMAASADDYAKENPWSMIAAAAGVGILSGVILGRK
jgi:ElaB/YqjD/DUF883 family membrane-anchored ribosome-binding protein